jgi:hypothetical protein
MGHYFNTNIPKENLHFIVDALNVMSYPGTGTRWTNLAKPGFNDLTHTNSPTFSAAGSSTSIAYNGSNQYSVNSSLTDPVRIQGPFTINVIFSPSSLTGTQNIFTLYDNASNALQIGYNGTTGQVWKFGGTSLLTYNYAGIGTVWHITYTCDGSNNSKVYVNGQLNNSGVVATNTGTPVFYTVGTYGAGAGQYFNGKVYYVSIHRQVHTDNEVEDTWHAIKRRFGYSGIGTNPVGEAVIGGLQGGQ